MTVHGWPLGEPDEALRLLKNWTGQDFGFDAAKWSEWLRANRKVYSRPAFLAKEKAQDSQE
jgi:hypothetical protein